MPSSLLGTAILALLGSSHLALAHMDMQYPPPLKSKFNPYAVAANDVDYSMTSPLLASGADFPCKGYQSLLGTAQGTSVATFAPGGKYNLTIEGAAYHDGGSCQASLSYDKAKTFTVIQSWVGECPISTGGSWDFTIPSDAPTGKDVLLAWTWFNEVGNREMYMNCASVTIAGGSSKRNDEVAKRDSTPFSSRPTIFVANVGNGCTTQANLDVIFPQPGPDVTTQGSKLAKPTGTCQAVSGGSDAGSGSASGSGSSSSAAATSAASASAGAGSGSGSESTSTTAEAAAPTVTGAGSGSGSAAGSGSGSPGTFITKTFTGAASFTPLGSVPSSQSLCSSVSSSASSLSGGVFLTSQGGGGTAATSDTAAATTLATSTVPAASAGTTSAAAPAGTGTATGSGTGSGSSGGGSTLSGACTDEGAWNCIGGTSFQRCASGSWSVPIAMAAGTSCTPGVSQTLWRRSGRVRRGWAW